jgi:hypothetical protein
MSVLLPLITALSQHACEMYSPEQKLFVHYGFAKNVSEKNIAAKFCNIPRQVPCKKTVQRIEELFRWTKINTEVCMSQSKKYQHC